VSASSTTTATAAATIATTADVGTQTGASFVARVVRPMTLGCGCLHCRILELRTNNCKAAGGTEGRIECDKIFLDAEYASSGK
jgi:hypothetical protein